MIFISHKKQENQQGGFALLFSVLLSSLLLAIGLSIFRIALKELDISSASRHSMNAFYAADSGRECISYWDTRKNKIPNLYNDSLPSSINITCGGSADVPVNVAISGSEPVRSDTMTITVPSMLVSSSTDPNFTDENFNIYIGRRITNRGEFLSDPREKLVTKSTSYGYDSSSGDRVERAIEWIQ